jgi:hypothetical protein
LPLLLAAGLAGPVRLRGLERARAVGAAAARAAAAGGDAAAFQWPLLGMSLAADAASRPLLLLTLIAWTLAGWFAAARITRAAALVLGRLARLRSPACNCCCWPATSPASTWGTPRSAFRPTCW